MSHFKRIPGIIMQSLEELLGLETPQSDIGVVRKAVQDKKTTFSFLYFSDVRKDVSDKDKYRFMTDLTLFGDREGFESIYIPERHFYEFGSIYANSAVMAAYLIPQTKSIRFRSAGITLPLHHPAEIVEWWAMNDVLSNGRVDLGFGSGWNKGDFIFAPNNYDERRKILSENLPIIEKLWRGESLEFVGPNNEPTSITVYPRPIQKEVSIWLLVSQNDEAFRYTGSKGYNIFSMLYGIDLEAFGKKVKIYKEGRQSAGLDPKGGIISLMMHTMIGKSSTAVKDAVEKPFKKYIKSAMDAHVASWTEAKGVIGEEEKKKMLEYSYQRYYKTGAVFGTVEKCKEVVDHAIDVGVDDIAFLMDFGVDYNQVRNSLPLLSKLIYPYL